MRKFDYYFECRLSIGDLESMIKDIKKERKKQFRCNRVKKTATMIFNINHCGVLKADRR